MRTKGFITALASAVIILGGCKGNGTLLPNVSGKAGEIIVAMDKNEWEGNLGSATREILAADYPLLPQQEPLFSLSNVPVSGFADLFKVHRNLLFFNISASDKSGVVYKNDVWAHPQCVIQVTAPTSDSAAVILRENSERIINSFEQAERDRIIANSIRYEEHSIAHRNAALKENVPGMFENTYMITSDAVTPEVSYIRFRGRQFAETRGLWEVYNDFMGGPFVSHSFYSKDGRYIIVLDGFVYAPKFDKRQYLRQVEAIMYSFEWEKEDEEGDGNK